MIAKQSENTYINRKVSVCAVKMIKQFTFIAAIIKQQKGHAKYIFRKVGNIELVRVFKMFFMEIFIKYVLFIKY